MEQIFLFVKKMADLPPKSGGVSSEKAEKKRKKSSKSSIDRGSKIERTDSWKRKPIVRRKKTLDNNITQYSKKYGKNLKGRKCHYVKGYIIVIIICTLLYSLTIKKIFDAPAFSARVPLFAQYACIKNWSTVQQ